MSHTSKIPPAKYATSDLPTDLEVGSLVFDSDTSEHKVFNGSSWDVVSGGGESFGTATIVFSNASTYDQIQGDLPVSWKQNDFNLKGLVIGTSCTSIGDFAFNACTSLTGLTTGLTIPNSVTSIGQYAFYYNFDLTGSLTIPNSVTTIGSGAFYFCDSLTVLTIPDSVTTIGKYAFRSCTDLTAVYTNTPAASWTGTNALQGTTALVNIYEGPDVIGQYTSTFQGGSGMTVSAWTNYPNIP